ncbi:hypothetical protein [Mesopusillimonas faecipullorum]|uniref:hypothetical protein n=1 Tax=Mesopusillimonas faecipullorum TaxID=2755040 RepID=UPI001D023E9E|nr:hypothetical protein [Mesopusillimonas faecipullorum]
MLVFIVFAYVSFVALIYLQIYYVDYKTDKLRHEETVRRYTTLAHSARFGELEIPAGSLINRGDPENYVDLPHNDPLMGLTAVRFSQVTEVAGVPAYAMSVEGTGLSLELVQPYQLESDEGSMLCPAGYVLFMQYPDKWIADEYRLEPPYAWFKPSEWQPASCFESTTGVMVLHVNKEGIYFPENGKVFEAKK